MSMGPLVCNDQTPAFETCKSSSTSGSNKNIITTRSERSRALQILGVIFLLWKSRQLRYGTLKFDTGVF